MLSMVGRADAIVEAMRLGANDYLTKPVVDEELVATLERLLSRSALLAQRDGLRAAVGEGSGDTVWQSEAMKRIREMIEQIASTDVTVLIQGESGTGKEIVARAVHSMSNRSDAALRQGELRSSSGGSARERALRLREGRLHGGRLAQARASSRWPTAGRCSSTRSAR